MAPSKNVRFCCTSEPENQQHHLNIFLKIKSTLNPTIAITKWQFLSKIYRVLRKTQFLLMTFKGEHKNFP